jgi:dipeptidyl aminopeptidase/acylaminoacyl peptidase
VIRRLGWRSVLRSMAVPVVVATLLAACGSSGAAASSVPAPKGLPRFYRVPVPLPSNRPGTLIKDQRVAASGVDGTAYRVMYVSRNEAGKAVAVTGLVFVPERPAPSGGYPVVSWGHGTNGMADSCAPSLDPASAVPLINGLLSQGWEVTASDYQGEGTPGLLPYLVGSVAAYNTIDIVRAARHMHVAEASKDYVVWGHSEGGQTAMFSLYLGASYAPDLDLKGVVAGAPPSQFADIYTFLSASPYRYYLFMATAGYNAAYGNKAAPLSEILTPLGRRLLPILEKGCSDYVAARIDKYPISAILKADPFTVPKWKTLLEKNDPASVTRSVAAPLLMIQGGADAEIPVVSTQLLAQHLCGLGQDLERWIYPGQSHSGVIGPSATDMAHWIADRFADQPNPDPYPPFGLMGIQTTTCPS